MLTLMIIIVEVLVFLVFLTAKEYRQKISVCEQ